jgi:hypothetical protein
MERVQHAIEVGRDGRARGRDRDPTNAGLSEFQQILQSGKILCIGATHCPCNEWSKHLREPGRTPSISETHESVAALRRLETVRCLHWKRTFERTHHEPLSGQQVNHFIGVDEISTYEAGLEGDAGAISKGR